MVKGRNQFDAGPLSANSVAVDKSGVIMAVASDDGHLKLYNDLTGKLEHSIKVHDDAVQDVVFDYNSKLIVTCGSDVSFRVSS